MTISPEALEKARAIVADWQGRHDVVLPIAAFRELVAALQAAPKLPDDLAGLEKRVLALRCVLKQTATTKYDADLSDRAAATIQSLVARIAELEAGIRDQMAFYAMNLTFLRGHAEDERIADTEFRRGRAARLLNKSGDDNVK